MTDCSNCIWLNVSESKCNWFGFDISILAPIDCKTKTLDCTPSVIKTNADRIRSLSDEALADAMSIGGIFGYFYMKPNGREKLLKWLKEEVNDTL